MAQSFPLGFALVAFAMAAVALMSQRFKTRVCESPRKRGTAGFLRHDERALHLTGPPKRAHAAENGIANNRPEVEWLGKSSGHNIMA